MCKYCCLALYCWVALSIQSDLVKNSPLGGRFGEVLPPGKNVWIKPCMVLFTFFSVADGVVPARRTSVLMVTAVPSSLRAKHW